MSEMCRGFNPSPIHEHGHIYSKLLTNIKKVFFSSSYLVTFILYFTVKTNVYQNLIKLVFSLI